MDLIHNLYIGFQTSLSLINLWYAFMGAMLGTLIGVLPGLGPIATIAMFFGIRPYREEVARLEAAGL